MILTTCASNKGASGGALVRANGELLGLVSNNVTVSKDKVLIPHMTIVVPSTVFLQRVKNYSRSGSKFKIFIINTNRNNFNWSVWANMLNFVDLKELDHLKTSNRSIQDLWSLSRTNKFIKSKLWLSRIKQNVISTCSE